MWLILIWILLILQLPATATCSSAPPDSPPGWWGETNQKSACSPGTPHASTHHQAPQHSGGKHSSGKHSSGKHSGGKHPSSHHSGSHHSGGHLSGSSHHSGGHLSGSSHHPSGRLSPRNRGNNSRPSSPERLDAARLRPLSPGLLRSRNADKAKTQQHVSNAGTFRSITGVSLPPHISTFTLIFTQVGT